MANSPARSVIDVGSVIDKYVIEALIGRGGMGAVFLARHRTLTDKKVAIKVLHAEIHDADIQARFKREAQIATRVNHPNIVEVHDFDVTPDGVPYLVLEYLEGQTLAQRIVQGPIPLEQVMSIVRQIGSALAAAHREGIVHRDLKPQNIFLVPTEVDGRMVEVAKVLDFGISKWRGSETVKTQESALLGTPQYMAPEQATGKHDSVDERTDVFALGSIVYEMLCGHPAFTGASIPEVVFKVVYEQPAPMTQTVPDSVASAVRQAMAKPAEDRFPTVSNFVEALTGTALTTFRPSMVTKPPADVGFASGSKKIANQEALGDTMGSGDYAGKLPSTPVPVVAGPPVRGSTPTVDSVSRPGVGTAETALPPPARKSKLPLILGGIAAIGATVAIMYVVMKRSDEPATKPPTETIGKVETATPDAAVQVAMAPPDVPAPATPPQPPQPPPDPGKEKDPKQVGSKKLPQNGNPSRQTGAPRPPPPPPIEDEPPSAPGEDVDLRETLDKARAAYASGELELAGRFANLASNQGGPKQRAQGAMIKGMIACQKRDVEQVNAAVNQLARNPAMRRKVADVCAANGIEIGR